MGWILYLARTIRSRFIAVSTPTHEEWFEDFPKSWIAKLLQLRDDDITELLRGKLHDSGTLIVCTGDEEPLGVRGLKVKIVYHCRAFGKIDRFLELK